MVIWSAVKEFTKSQEIIDTGTKKPHIVTSNIEHDSIKLVLENFEKEVNAGTILEFLKESH